MLQGLSGLELVAMEHVLSKSVEARTSRRRYIPAKSDHMKVVEENSQENIFKHKTRLRRSLDGRKLPRRTWSRARPLITQQHVYQPTRTNKSATCCTSAMARCASKLS